MILVNIQLGNWAELQQEAKIIRTQVFVEEQNVPVDIELDDMDVHCLHALAYHETGQAMGTGRLLPDGHIGRMAVLPAYRNMGVGAAILRALMAQAKLRGQTSVQLNAQIAAENFYRRHGFVRQGEQFQEAGITHVHMYADLSLL